MSGTAAPGWLASRFERFNGRARLTGVDFARGLAVVGMFAAHLVVIPEIVWTDAATWTGIVHGRSSILFATLAGVSIGLLTGGARRADADEQNTARRRLVIRAIAIWAIGFVLIATGVPVYVILPAYAILFLVATAFTGLRARTLFVWAAAIALLMPVVQAVIDSQPFWATAEGNDLSLIIGWHYPFLTWFAFILAGMGAARSDLRALRTQVLLLVVGGALAVIAYVLDAFTGSADEGSLWDAVWTARAHSTGLLEVVGSGGFALAILGLCLLACRTPIVWIVLPLRAMGSMPLTAYTVQLVAWVLLQPEPQGTESNLEAFRAVDPFWPMTLAVIAGCTAWALLIGRGPLEWAIDRLARFIVPGSSRRLAHSPGA